MNNKTLITDAPQRARLTICLLGRFKVRVGDKWIETERWHLRKARQLLMLLALAPNHRLHREQIFDLLWPDFDPAAADNNFRRTLHATRRTLAPAPAPFDAYVRLQGTDVCLVDDSLWVDVAEFAAAADRARREPTAEAFGRAIALYGGDLVPEERYNEWLSARRERLQSDFLTLWHDLAALHESRNEPLQAIQAYREVLEVEPTHEDVHTRLMRLYGVTGQRHLAVRQYRVLQDVLRRELDVAPTPKSRQLYEQLLEGQQERETVDNRRNDSTPSPAVKDAAPGPSSAPLECVHNLPTPLTPFVRDASELETAIRLLKSSRLLTLTGTGGAGKSRFALEVARRIEDEYEDGVQLIDLAELTDPASVRDTLTATFEVAMTDDRAFRNGDSSTHHSNSTKHPNSTKHRLIILDNCEHVVKLCQQLVDRLLPLHPRTDVLVTSRQSLGVPGEVVWPLPALSIPDADCDLPAKKLQEQYSAIALFMHYAVRTRPDFQLTQQNADAIISICRQLDGNPLALKLAAARVHMLAPAQIAALLDDPFSLLQSDDRIGPPRHRTLRATIDRCYHLLTPKLQQLFHQLSIFEEPFTLEKAASAAAHTSSAQASADSSSGKNERYFTETAIGRHNTALPHPLLIRLLNDLSSLVAQSMIVAERDEEGAIRYRMPTILRRYARSRL